MSLNNISERTTMARRWRAHLDATYLPDRAGTTTVKEAADERVH